MESFRFRRLASVLLAGTVIAASSCSVPTPEERSKAAEESARRSLVALDDGALDQQVDPEKLKTIQQQLTAIDEYQGEVNGKLDQVTVNAYGAFQRSNEITPNGMFDDNTLRLLEEAAAKRGAAPQG